MAWVQCDQCGGGYDPRFRTWDVPRFRTLCDRCAPRELRATTSHRACSMRRPCDNWCPFDPTSPRTDSAPSRDLYALVIHFDRRTVHRLGAPCAVCPTEDRDG